MLLDKLERKYGRYAIPNVTLAFILPQVAVYILSLPQPQILDAFRLVPALVLQGQVWRLLTFLTVPPMMNPIFAFFFWYLFYLMGNSLENHWGAFRYNIYLLVGYLATVLVSFLAPFQASSNAFLQGSVFLAFAYLFPDFQLYILFVLPVRIKWLALITAAYYFYVIAFGDWLSKFLVLASVANFLLFFGNDILYRMKSGRRHMEGQVFRTRANPEKEYYHRCTICGVTDAADLDMTFRYCSDCEPTSCYCMNHLAGHQHISQPENAMSS